MTAPEATDGGQPTAALRWSSPGLHLADPGLTATTVAERATAEGAWVGIADAGRSKRELLDALADVLSLPAWFGRNWDALEESLGDLDRLPHRARVLVLVGIDGLLPGDRRVLVEVLAGAVLRWAPTATPLSVVLCEAPPGDAASADVASGDADRAEGPRPNGEEAP